MTRWQLAHVDLVHRCDLVLTLALPDYYVFPCLALPGLQSVMGVGDEVGTLRWTRCIVELVGAASHMCPTSMGVAYLEMLHKLSRWVLPGTAL